MKDAPRTEDWRKTEGRTWRFWTGGFVLLVLVHAAAIVRLSERNSRPPTVPEMRPFFYLSLDDASDRRIAELTAGRDPTLFALPQPHGFSGGAWSQFQPELPKLSNWSAPPEWLAFPAEQLGNSLHDYVATNRPSVEPLLAALRATRPLEVRIPGQPLLTNTIFRVEGALTARRLISAPPLPGLPGSEVPPLEVPRATIITVSVNGDGVVETASLAGTAGLKTADNRALELARRFAFAPAAIRDARAREAAPPTLGRIVFTWQVLPPVSALTGTASTR